MAEANQHKCIQDARITRNEQQQERDEQMLSKYIDESIPVRDRLTKVEALAKGLDERVYAHRYNERTGWEPRMQTVEKAVTEISQNLAPVAEWMRKSLEKKEWWEHQIIGVALQIITVMILVIMGLRGI